MAHTFDKYKVFSLSLEKKIVKKKPIPTFPNNIRVFYV